MSNVLPKGLNRKVVIDMLTFPEAIAFAITAAFNMCSWLWKLLITKINLSPKEHNFHD